MTTTIITALLLLTGLGGMAGTLTWVLIRGNSNRLTRLFIICQSAVILWLISQLMILFSANSRQLWISYLVGNLGICIFSPFWLMFAAEYSDFRDRLRRASYIMPAVSAGAFICVLTNPIHMLYYSDFAYGTVVCGRLFYLFQILYYVLILAGICLIFVRHSQGSRRMTNRSVLLALAIAVPLCINTLTVTRIINARIELTPLFFAFSMIMILIAISRYGLLNINRIAINETIDIIDSAVIVFDSDDIMTYMNRCAAALVPIKRGASLAELCGFVKERTGTAPDINASSYELTFGGAHYNIRQNFSTNRNGERIARIIIVNNVSEYYELLDTEKKLSLEQERNRIAQEIHDSAGHTFTMISSLSRIISADLADTRVSPETAECVSEIDGLARSGVTQLRCSINNLRSDEFMTSVTGAINTVTSAVRGVQTDICVQGEEDDSFAFCIKTVYDNARETITNAMRYSGADRIDIIVKFRPEALELYILDNGRGCSEISENNGLRGIRERTEALGGSVRFTSVEGEGFSTAIKIPKKKGEGNDKGITG